MIYLTLVFILCLEFKLAEGFLDAASQFMAFVHGSVSDMCRSMLLNEGRYAYTTPKSYLEQLQLFVRLLERETSLLRAKVERLENGLDRLRVASLQVDDLKEVLAIQEVELQRKTEEADRLIQVLGRIPGILESNLKVECYFI